MSEVVSTSLDPARLADEVEACLNGRPDGRAFLAFLSESPNRLAQVQAFAQMRLKRGRAQEATRVYQAVVLALEGRPDAEFALAVTFYDAGQESEAETTCRRALKNGLRGPDPWVFLARLLQGQNRLSEAENALMKANREARRSPKAHREWAHLVWMRTGDVSLALRELNVAPKTSALSAIAVRLLQDAGDEVAAFQLACQRAASDPRLIILAARAGVAVELDAAERLLAQAPPDANPSVKARAEIEIDLARGECGRAARRAEALHRQLPDDHYVTALLATAWRLADDPRYRTVYDYTAQVKSYQIVPPAGWTTLDAYLEDLSEALDQVHTGLTYPIGQSLRRGSQTLRDLREYGAPSIQGLFDAIKAPANAYTASLGSSDCTVSGAWSVRLASHGRHVDHIHPDGLISSAFCVRLPKGLSGHEGWLKFGQPGVRTAPRLGADHYVRPEPGVMVLFPSYYWHGTVPFEAAQTRLTCAFDFVVAGGFPRSAPAVSS